MLGLLHDELTEAANNLQQAGIIRNRRGYVTVLDHSRLERHASEYYCEYYDVFTAEFKRLL